MNPGDLQKLQMAMRGEDVCSLHGGYVELWGEEYNRHNPPKKVDIFQMAVLEMVERKGT